MENSTIAAPSKPDLAGKNNSKTHHNYHHSEPDHHYHHVRGALHSTSILLIVIFIFIVILLLAIFLFIVILKKIQSSKNHGSTKSGSIISNKECVFIAHSSISINSSPDVKGGCLYGSTSTKMASSKFRGVQVFTYKELEMATNKFSAANVIGNGGYGVVYKGILSDGTVAAIKVLHREGKQGERAFRLEVDLLSRLH
ncbi:hypothetical protein ACH5RR_001416 [Cinchona calisaya]|uniref:Protein kinase domain-containing protein n=1 Tax=Cinchona calisaya TaxID=153742 RepID=A0ABD3B3C7_9GENT